MAEYDMEPVSPDIAKRSLRPAPQGYEMEPVAGPPSAEPAPIPEAFIDRVAKGRVLEQVASLRQQLGAVGDAASKGWKEGTKDATPTGFSDQSLEDLQRLGIFHRPGQTPGPIHLLNETALGSIARLWQGLTLGINGGVHALGGIAGELAAEWAENKDGVREQVRRETINMANYAMLLTGNLKPSPSQLRRTPEGKIVDVSIGDLPKPVEFKTASQRVMADYDMMHPLTPERPSVWDQMMVEAELKRKWQDEGMTPAEAWDDARRDPFAMNDLVSAEREPTALSPEATEVFTETGGKPHSLSAAASLPPDNVPFTPENPRPQPGGMIAAMKSGIDNIFNMGYSLQMILAPMARGTAEAQAIVKDYANTMRRNRWNWRREDAALEREFTPEQRKRMWDAADEESVARQLGESTEHQGLTTLTPEERARVEDLQARGQMAWLQAVDLGMVQGEGLPSYTPRMAINIATSDGHPGPIALNSMGHDLKVRTAQMNRRRYLTAEETEAALKDRFGDQAELARDIRALPLATARLEDAIAGRTLINEIKEAGRRTGDEVVVEGHIPAGSEHKWFTLEHPAFKTWRPKFEREAETGALRAMKDAEGNIIFEQVPIYVRGDFEGPLRSVMWKKDGPIYHAFMELKGKTMGLIMNSPMIHNLVELGRSLPAAPGKILTGKIYFEGNRAKNDVIVMREAIDAGLVPIGARFFKQDISGVMEAPDLTPGRSWTSKVLAYFPGLFDPEAGVAVKRAVDKAGDFWHNTLLWDRIGDLQMGLYVNMRDGAIAKGIEPQTAQRLAAHWANRYAGALPQEAMSQQATKIANFAMFSRSFTLGNLGVMKDMVTGLPKDVLAQIQRDQGVIDPKASGYAKSLARRRAASIVAIDVALMYAANSILQSAINVLRGDNTLETELHGYANRMHDAMQKRIDNPMTLLQPFDFLESLSSTSENEPGKKDRIFIGYTKDGQAIYARNPVGKIGEEFVGYISGPLDMMRRKLGTIARPGLQIISNDQGYGRKVYDPSAESIPGYTKNLLLIAWHMMKAQAPEGQLQAGVDLVKGDGDAKLNTMQLLGPVLGTTFSKGAPGGPPMGELYKAREHQNFKVQMALPDIRKQIQRGDIAGALAKMNELGVAPGLQKYYIKSTVDPSARMSGRIMRDFYLHATPEQRQRFENTLQNRRFPGVEQKE